MDLLGSILNAMNKPPTLSQSDKIRKKNERKTFDSVKDKEKEMLKQLRKMASDKINDFLNNSQYTRLKFDPMEQLHRNVIRDIAEDFGVIWYSFGIEGEDRYVMLFKKQDPPSEDELATLRAGEEWHEHRSKELAHKRKLDQEDKQKVNITKPTHNYKEKYQHIIGVDSVREAARKTETNKLYGFVPSANKKDQRTIEQTLADIRMKKKLKLTHNPDSTH